MNKSKITSVEYRKILEGLELLSISLKEAKCYLNTDVKFPSELSISINSKEDFKIKDEELVELTQKYILDARRKNSRSRLLLIELTLIIKLKSEEKFTEEFFNVYKDISLKLNTWPYFREFVNSITQRMNIPPLTLPLFKVNI